MGKYNIDDILSELGVEEETPANTKAKKHRVDEAPDSFSPLPSMPANQRGFNTANLPAAPDPAVKKRIGSSAPSVGPALAEIYRPEDGVPSKELGELLLTKGVISAEKLNTAQQVVRGSPGRRLVDVLVEQGGDEAGIQQAVAELARIPFERIDFEKGLEGGFDGKMLQRMTPGFCKQNQVIPLRMDGSRLVVATTTPDNPFLLDEVRSKVGVPVKFVLTTGFDIKGALEIVGEGEREAVDVSQILAEVQEGDVQVESNKSDEVDLEKVAEEGPVIRYVNHIIQLAITQGASDIHIEPSEKKIKVRFRIDGELYESLNPPAAMAAAITSRLKIMAGLAIDQRRIPQDGRIRCKVQGRNIDLRVSTLPSVGGEKTVMRILNEKSISVGLDDLGFDANTLTIWRKQVDSPHGIILVTGPTGSGKTTTLYASLRQLDRNGMNISTVEDPVEYTLEGITQTQVHERAGMTFAVALKAMLRQDPDVIMLGEVRDHETALTAVQAALTGHLVLSTLHTNDAPSSITRLVNIGLEPFLVGAAVNAVLAQRLLRRLCTHCKAMEKPGEELAEFLAMHSMDADEMWVAKGCDKCRKTGYSGRVGIYELLVVDDQLRDAIARNPNVAEFRRMCIERGMATLRSDGMRKVAEAVTTVQEVLRVTEAVH
ncbi:putative type II secretion system protein HxcR [Phycisphaerales bacterium]|nr:putative type II secretion system protein HxcR [Phycisphaerales bacterium]